MVAQTTVAVAATSTLVLAANASRDYVIVQNVSDTDVYLALGGAASVGSGILLRSGAAYELEAGERLADLVQGTFYGIHGGSGNKSVTVTVKG